MELFWLSFQPIRAVFNMLMQPPDIWLVDWNPYTSSKYPLYNWAMSPPIQNDCQRCFMLLSIIPEAAAVELKYAPPKKKLVARTWNGTSPKRKSSSTPGNKRLQPWTLTHSYSLKSRGWKTKYDFLCQKDPHLPTPLPGEASCCQTPRRVGHGFTFAFRLRVLPGDNLLFVTLLLSFCRQQRIWPTCVQFQTRNLASFSTFGSQSPNGPRL